MSKVTDEREGSVVDAGASVPDQALVSDQAASRLAPTGFDPSRKKVAKLRAWSVTEEDEGTGGIVFAKHGIVALKNGACEFGSGEWEYYKARRAPWADAYAEAGHMPASVMVEHGWNFECSGCGVRIDGDLPDMKRLFRNWTPEQVVGSQHQVWCTSRCHDDDMKERADRKRYEGLIVDMMARLVKRRFPSVEIIQDRANLTPHIHLKKKHGFWRLSQAIVSFNFPGMKIAPASYRWDRDSSYGNNKAHFTCCVGDQEAFEAFARDSDGNPKGGNEVPSRSDDSAGIEDASPESQSEAP